MSMSINLHTCKTCSYSTKCGWEHKYNNEKHDCYRYEVKMNTKPTYNDVVDKLFDADVVLRHFCINYRKNNTDKIYECQGCPFHSDVGCYHAKFRGEMMWLHELDTEIDKREEKYATEQGWTGNE